MRLSCLNCDKLAMAKFIWLQAVCMFTESDCEILNKGSMYVKYFSYTHNKYTNLGLSSYHVSSAALLIESTIDPTENLCLDYCIEYTA